MKYHHLALSFLLAISVSADSTRTWEQTRFEDFEKGVADHISLRSDGRLVLAPRFEEVYDAPPAYLWALAQDSKGNLYCGGGPGARVFKVTPDGRKSKFFENDALEIHALAVDSKDNLYAATSPDSKIYKIEQSGRSSLFLDPKVKYVWAMAFDGKGELFLATGDKGEVLRVDVSGTAHQFFKSDESHVRSLLIDKTNDVIVGTDPGGLVIRIPASGGPPFVLYQSSKKEITALARASDGALYAAGVGTRSRVLGPAPVPALSPAPAPVPSSLTGQGPAPPAPVPQTAPLPPTLRNTTNGGSEVFRIGLDGSPRKLWTSGDEIVYAIGFSPAGKVLLGTGNLGRIYQLESDHVYSLLIKAAPTQITSFLQDSGGKVFVATGNVGKIYRLGPELEPKGAFESEVFDAGMFSRWGRLNWKGTTPEGTALSAQTRSGNLNTPAQYWSPWSKAVTTQQGAPVDSPPARFVQWKAVLETRNGQSPLLESVTLAYLPKNLPPTISELEITPPNHRFPDPPAPSTPPKTITLPPVGGRPPSRLSSSPAQPARSMIPARGYLGARWLPQDDNEDDLVYKVEIRGIREQNWKPLREKLEEPYLSWDSTAFADGTYLLRVTASDSPSNPGSEALTYVKESDPFVIDNTPPVLSGLSAAVGGNRLRVRLRAADALSNVEEAEYSLDGGEWRPMLPVTRLFDSRELDFDFFIEEVKPGEHTVAVRVADANENLAVAKVVVH